MQYRTHQDLIISEIGVGCYALGGVYGQVDQPEFQFMLRRAYELGVNFFDTVNEEYDILTTGRIGIPININRHIHPAIQ